MGRLFRLVLYVVGGSALLLLLAAVAIGLLLDAEVYRDRLQDRASAAADMQVEIAGPLQFRVLPRLQLTVNDVRAGRDGEDIASADSLTLGIALLPLLRGDVKVTHIALLTPVLYLERYPDGRFNIERDDEDDAGPLTAQNIGKITLHNATLQYREGQSGATYVGTACNGDGAMALLAGPREDLLANLDVQAQVTCDSVRRNEFGVNKVAMTLTGNAGVFTVDPFEMSVFGATGTGTLTADASRAPPAFELDFALPAFQSEAVLDAMDPARTITGSLDFSATLAMQGNSVDAITSSMSGQLSLKGGELVLHGIDLDDELAQFESTQDFNLVDMGALFFAGPLGLAVTKGYDYASLFQNSESNSEIRALVSEWAVTNGVAHAQDVAMATAENRIAVKGTLNFNTGEFVDMKMAVVDANGCVRIEQAIHGTFREPVIDKPGILQSLAAPAVSLVQQGLELLPGEDESCEPFYAGSLQPK